MTETSNEELRRRIAELELDNGNLRHKLNTLTHSTTEECDHQTSDSNGDLTLEEYLRYGRQMIVPLFGSLKSQLKLRKAKALVIGAGGLGCPALQYLSAAGIGEIGIIDGDKVEVSNLHRQVLHNTRSLGQYKCESAKKYIQLLNPHVKIKTYMEHLTNGNAFEIIKDYDLVLDCTDSPATRYLINDVCVLSKKTIVSGSGLRSDGQLTVLNFKNIGPCYRCFYPKPPSPGSVSSCSDSGVIGPAIGLIGVAMASEAIKVITDFYSESNFEPFLASYTGYPYQQLRNFKMRKRQASCVICGTCPMISRSDIETGKIDYASFCGKIDSNVLDAKHRISVEELRDSMTTRKEDKTKCVIIDVRPKEQYEIVSLPNSINIPWESTFSKLESLDTFLLNTYNNQNTKMYTICRYGNDSQFAAKMLIEKFGCKNVQDIKGGLNKWSEVIEKSIPKY